VNRNVLLVKPPERSAFSFGAFSLGALAAAIRDRAEVSILDATELSADEAAARILAAEPSLAGITAMGTVSVKPVADLIQRLRASAAQFTIVCGGHGASCLPGALLDAGADAVVFGEGEVTFQAILEDGIRLGCPGVACRVNGQVVAGPARKLVFPLDSLPSPARDLMPPPPDDIHLMETSRGCPHACAFCETTRFYQRRWRPKSPERTAVEVNSLVKDHGAWIIHLTDDNFAADPTRVRRICAALREASLPAFFLVSARADDLLAHPDLLPAMAAARMLRISVGVETLDPDTALHAGKPIALETYRTAFSRMRELGIFSVASLIVGLPGESARARESAVELAVEAGPDAAQFVAFLPLPGIPLASGYSGIEPRPEDVRDAGAFTQAFYRHPAVCARLEAAAGNGGVPGLLAQGTLQRYYAESMWRTLEPSTL
jgi:radical SAM superfamily enzyme YgiQ (UPF0313 family)